MHVLHVLCVAPPGLCCCHFIHERARRGNRGSASLSVFQSVTNWSVLSVNSSGVHVCVRVWSNDNDEPSALGFTAGRRGGPPLAGPSLAARSCAQAPGHPPVSWPRCAVLCCGPHGSAQTSEPLNLLSAWATALGPRQSRGACCCCVLARGGPGVYQRRCWHGRYVYVCTVCVCVCVCTFMLCVCVCLCVRARARAHACLCAGPGLGAKGPLELQAWGPLARRGGGMRTPLQCVCKQRGRVNKRG